MTDIDEPSSPDELDRLEQVIDEWLEAQRVENPVVAAVEHGEPGERRWFVRVHGEQKSVFSIWFWLRQRSLHVETYFMPAPEEQHAELYEYLLRRNSKLTTMRFAIGEEDAVFLVTEIDNASVSPSVLDRALGSAYAYTEHYFRPAMRIGYASKFQG